MTDLKHQREPAARGANPPVAVAPATHASDSVSPRPIPDPVASESADASANGWSVEEDESEMDGSPTVVLSINSTAMISGWLKTTTPTLVVRCLEHKTDVYVVTGMSAQPELGSYNEYTVQIRLDEHRPITRHWSESTDNEALAAPDAVAFSRRLLKTNSMLFRFTPFKSSEATAKFSLIGLPRYLPKVAKACGWNL
jgi:hypothetical protein